MTITIERCIYLVVVALASVILWTVVLAVSSAVALAQATDTTTNDLQAAKRSANPDAAGDVVAVVEPGDSLWSISEELLGPRATPPRVERLVERTYALNRETIGENPHLLLPGQKLLLPPVVGATPALTTSAAKPATDVEPARGAASEATPAAGRAAERAPGTLDGSPKSPSKAAEASAAGAAKPVDLPEAVRSAVVPAARPVASDAVSPSVESLLTFLKEAHSTASNVVAGVAAAFPQDANLQRRLLGGGIILLTLLFTALMAWKLPMRRREYWETWRVQSDFRYRYAHSGENHAAVRSTKDGETAGKSGEEITTSGNRAARPWGMLALARTRRLRLIRRGEKQGPRRHKRKRLATGTYTPHARRYLRNMSKGASRKPAGRSTRPFSGSSRSAKARSAAMRRRRKARSR